MDWHHFGTINKLNTAKISVLRNEMYHNPGSNTLVLGSYDPNHVSGYVEVAQARGATYFQIDQDQWTSLTNSSFSNLTEDDMFVQLNVAIIDHAINNHKKILFSHDPRNLPRRPDGTKRALAKEWDHLQRHGYRTIVRNGDVWEVTRTPFRSTR